MTDETTLAIQRDTIYALIDELNRKIPDPDYFPDDPAEQTKWRHDCEHLLERLEMQMAIYRSIKGELVVYFKSPQD